MKYQKILGLVATVGLLLAGCATDPFIVSRCPFGG